MAADEKLGLPIRLHDEDNLAYTESNPLPVTISESEVGDPVHAPQTDVDVAKPIAGIPQSVNHDYTVTALKTLFLEQFIFAGSGRAKFDLQIETGVATGIYTSKAIGMISVSKLSDQVTFRRSLEVAAGVKVRITKTNLDNDDQNLYTTIVGLEK